LFKERQENEGRDRPAGRCLPHTIPNAMMVPNYPWKIVQTPGLTIVLFENFTQYRQIFTDGRDFPTERQPAWFGYSLGKWEGDAFVVETLGFNDKSWLDSSGYPHGEKLHLVERFRKTDPQTLRYEVTIEDPKVFTRPWTISMPLYRRLEPNMELLEYRCIEFVEEFLFGNLRKQQLVKRWEGDTIIVDITRKVPPDDKLYEWYRR
ncbi:MAG: hypothetical protein ACREUP_09770, partial [Burkholderiales bacterium]